MQDRNLLEKNDKNYQLGIVGPGKITAGFEAGHLKVERRILYLV